MPGWSCCSFLSDAKFTSYVTTIRPSRWAVLKSASSDNPNQPASLTSRVSYPRPRKKTVTCGATFSSTNQRRTLDLEVGSLEALGGILEGSLDIVFGHMGILGGDFLYRHSASYHTENKIHGNTRPFKDRSSPEYGWITDDLLRHNKASIANWLVLPKVPRDKEGGQPGLSPEDETCLGQGAERVVGKKSSCVAWASPSIFLVVSNGSGALTGGSNFLGGERVPANDG